MPNFARRDPPLEKVFPSSGAPLQGPSELHDGVQLVHPWPGRAARLHQQSLVRIQSPAAVTPQIDTEPVALGRYWECLALNLTHTSAGAQTMHLSLVDPLNQGVILTRVEIIGNASWAGLGSHFSTGGYLYPPPLYVPGLWRLRLTGDVAGAAYVVELRGLIIEHELAEEPLS